MVALRADRVCVRVHQRGSAPRKRASWSPTRTAHAAKQAAVPGNHGSLDSSGRCSATAGIQADVELPIDRLRRYCLISVSAASLLAVDRLAKWAFVEAGIRFPASLAVSSCLLVALLAGSAAGPRVRAAVDAIVDYYAPLRDWLARWMPVFFVPSLIQLPLVASGISTQQLVSLAQVTLVGWGVSLALAVASVQMLRKFSHAELTPEEEAATARKPVAAFSAGHYLFWLAVTVTSAVLAPLFPGAAAALGTVYLLSSVVVGYLLGVAMPRAVRTVMHPLVTCMLYGSLSCMAWGVISGQSYASVLAHFMQKGAFPLGAGNLLMSMLSAVVVSDAFRVFLQRKLIQRHALEIFGTVFVSATASLFVTAKLAVMADLGPTLARSLLARSITVPLALPITEALEGQVSLTAGVVCFTGLVGAALGQLLMNALRVRDEISRGVSQAASAHGLGTSAMAASEPQALPFCAVTIAVMGFFSNCLVNVPFVYQALMAMTA